MPELKGFVGGAYEAANPMQDSQRLINWYVEVSQDEESKTPKALLGAPGLVDLGQSTFTGQVRGACVLPGGTSALVVVGNVVLLMTVATGATNSTRPVFQWQAIGSLLSTNGPVNMRSNGAGLCVAIVDGSNLYAYNTLTKVLLSVVDPGFLGSAAVAEIDGWFIFAQPGTQRFYTAPLYWNGLTAFDATYYALKDDAPDNIVAIIENNRELWLIGEATTEVWYNAGGQYFPFSRLQGTMQQIGCAAAQSVARYGAGLVWLSRSERGENAVVMTEGYQSKAISNPALSNALGQYPIISDAIGYTYSEEGHEFYVLTFPSANATWVYDFTTGYWHQRAGYYSGTLGRQRANCLWHMLGMQIAGDFQTGQIYWQTRSAYSDGTQPLVCVRRAPHIWDKGDRNRVRHSRLQIEFTAGVGTSTGQGAQPVAMLRWSDDGARSWSNQRSAAIGAIGARLTRAIWRRIGMARDRIYEVTFSDPVPRDIVGATLTASETGA